MPYSCWETQGLGHCLKCRRLHAVSGGHKRGTKYRLELVVAPRHVDKRAQGLHVGLHHAPPLAYSIILGLRPLSVLCAVSHTTPPTPQDLIASAGYALTFLLGGRAMQRSYPEASKAPKYRLSIYAWFLYFLPCTRNRQ